MPDTEAMIAVISTTIGAVVLALLLWRWAAALLTVDRPRWFHPVVVAALAGALALGITPLFHVTSLVRGLPLVLALVWWGAANAHMALIDLAEQHLPPPLTLSTAVVLIVTFGAQALVQRHAGAWGRALLAMLIVTVLLFAAAWFSGNRFNLGDVALGISLALLLGWLGWSFVLYGMLMGFVLGALVSVVMLAGRRMGMKGEYAFGPCMIAGAILGGWWAHLFG